MEKIVEKMIDNIKKIEKNLLLLHKRKDKVMELSRDIVRLSGKAITLVHSNDMISSKKLIHELGKMNGALRSIESGFEYNSQQAHQEYVEAYSVYNMVLKESIPSLKELKTDEISYLLGLLDAVGELKRQAFDELRKGNTKKTETYYCLMLEIYDSTVPLRFANSIVPEFRKKQDVARMQIERTGTELLFFSDNRKGALK